MNLTSYQDAKKRFLSGDFSVGNFFNQNDFILEYGYCLLLSGDVESAKSEFTKISERDCRADWATKLIPFIQEHVFVIPSYFQIRNFLEIDLNLLLLAEQAQFVENIINRDDLFYSINPESYKFIARVMLNNEFPKVALHYLQKAKDKYYYDPEMHFMLANCYISLDDKVLAKVAIRNCLKILPEYTPAKKIQNMLL